MIITLKELKRLDACKGEVHRFEKLFGKSVRVTKKLCLKHAQDVDWDWAAWHLLGDDAREAYHAARHSAWVVYWAGTQSAWLAFLAARLPAWEVYNVAKALAFYKATLI